MDTTSTGTRKQITKWAIGARIAPGIPRVLGIGIIPHTIRILVVSDILMDPCEGKNSRSFRSDRGLSTPKRSPNWENMGIGGWKMPGFGV